MEEELIAIPRSPERDPDGSRFRAALAAHLSYERLKGMRRQLVGLVAVTSIFVWAAAAWPGIVSLRLRSIALAAWVVSFGCLAVLLAWERSERRIRDQLIKDLGGNPLS